MSRVSDLLMQHAEQVGNARLGQARIWSNIANALGQIPGQMVETYNAEKDAAQRRELTGTQIAGAKLNLSEAERQRSAQSAVDVAMQQSTNPAMANQGPSQTEPSGVMATPDYTKKEGDTTLWDEDALAKALAAQGVGSEAASVLEGVRKQNDRARASAQFRLQLDKAVTAEVGTAAGIALSLLQSGMDRKQAFALASRIPVANKSLFGPEWEQQSAALMQMPDEQLAAALRKFASFGEGEEFTLQPGEVRMKGTTPVAAGGSAPLQRAAPGSVAIGPEGRPIPGTEVPLGEAWGPPQDVVVPGRGQTRVQTNNRTGQTRTMDGQILPPDVAARIVGYHAPPATIQVNREVEDILANYEISPYRPEDQSTANTMNPKTGMTPNSAFQLGTQYAMTGQIPSQGFGQSVRPQVARTVIPAIAAAQAEVAGVLIGDVRREYAAATTATKNMAVFTSRTAAAASAASGMLDLALTQSEDIARGGARFVNKPYLFVKGELTPAPNLSAFEVDIYAAARDYAKVVTGSAGSVAELTAKAVEQVSKLLNAAKAPQAFAATVAEMKADMAKVTSSQMQQLVGQSPLLANFVSAVNGLGRLDTSTVIANAPGTTPTSPPLGTSTTAPTAKPGYVIVYGPGGVVRQKKADAPLVSGWSLTPPR